MIAGDQLAPTGPGIATQVGRGPGLRNLGPLHGGLLAGRVVGIPVRGGDPPIPRGRPPVFRSGCPVGPRLHPQLRQVLGLRGIQRCRLLAELGGRRAAARRGVPLLGGP